MSSWRYAGIGCGSVAAVVLVLGWVGKTESVIRAAWMGALGVAFLPGVITGVVLLVCLGVGLLLTILSMDEVPLLGDLVEWIVLGGRRFFRFYYGRLGRQPVFWSVPAGLLLGAAALWAAAR